MIANPENTRNNLRRYWDKTREKYIIEDGLDSKEATQKAWQDVRSIIPLTVYKDAQNIAGSAKGIGFWLGLEIVLATALWLERKERELCQSRK